MNCWKIELPGKCIRFAANEADARRFRDTVAGECGVAKKAVSISPAEIPTTKPELIDALNELAGTKDKP